MRLPINRPIHRTTRRAAGGFTLVEILIVVVILGILASIIVPQLASATHEAREAALRDDLRYLRVQVQLYKAQHRDVPPGYPGGNANAVPTEAAFNEQMVQFTSEAGATSPSHSSTFKFGPYLSVIPKNPLNEMDTVMMVDNSAVAMPPADGTTGWIYWPKTQEIIANTLGSDGSGTLYSKY